MGSMVVIVVRYPVINFGLSAFNYRIIHIRRMSLTPNPHPHPHTIGFGLSTSAWISKNLLQIRIIRIRIGSNAEIIHTTFIPSRVRAPRMESWPRPPPPHLTRRRLRERQQGGRRSRNIVVRHGSPDKTSVSSCGAAALLDRRRAG
jgi:hypothetical protein